MNVLAKANPGNTYSSCADGIFDMSLARITEVSEKMVLLFRLELYFLFLIVQNKNNCDSMKFYFYYSLQ